MFSERLTHLRMLYKLSQSELAFKLGLAKQTVSNWENGNAVPSIEKLRQIAKFFHVTTDYLLSMDNERLGNGEYIEVTGLSVEQSFYIQSLIDDLRKK